jgi:hypothetical protein
MNEFNMRTGMQSFLPVWTKMLIHALVTTHDGDTAATRGRGGPRAALPVLPVRHEGLYEGAGAGDGGN